MWAGGCVGGWLCVCRGRYLVGLTTFRLIGISAVIDFAGFPINIK